MQKCILQIFENSAGKEEEHTGSPVGMPPQQWLSGDTRRPRGPRVKCVCCCNTVFCPTLTLHRLTLGLVKINPTTSVNCVNVEEPNLGGAGRPMSLPLGGQKLHHERPPGGAGRWFHLRARESSKRGRGQMWNFPRPPSHTGRWGLEI